MPRNDLNSLGNLYTGTLTQPASDTQFADMRLFQQAHSNSQVGQGTGAVTHTTGLALKGQAQLLIDSRLPHIDLGHYGRGLVFHRLDRSCRAGITALHAQNAGLIPGDDVGRIPLRQTLLLVEELDALIGADLRALPAANAGLEKIFLGKGARGTQIAHTEASRNRPGQARKGCAQETQAQFC